ncbi:hypothetical protein G9A89_007381 [Geosiphon pyriformis]|nr:hypothetical protein G9A89_007381 [Geosiphon pyriformis]
MAYTPITKIEKFTSKKDDIQHSKPSHTSFRIPQIHDIKAWPTNLKISTQETEAVTTYLGYFYRNLHQIQAINTNYFIIAQILIQFIYGLCSTNLQATVTQARDFEAAKLKTNHIQTVNLVMNRSFELDSKLKQFTTNLPNPNLLNSSTSYLPTTATLSGNQRLRIVQQNWKSVMVVYQLISSSFNYALRSHLRNLGNMYNQNLSSQNYLSLLVIPEDVSTNNLETSSKQMINNNISPAIITDDKLLAAIFPFEIKRPTKTPLFSKVALDTKTITAMYTDTKINRQVIKLILNSGSAGSIIT